MTLEEVSKLLKEKSSNTTVVKGGIGPLSLLGIALVVLKAMGYITWSWLWVLAPFWIPVAIALVLIVFLFCAMFYLFSQEEKVFKVTTTPEKEVKVEPKEETPKKATVNKSTSKTKKDGKSTKGKNE